MPVLDRRTGSVNERNIRQRDDRSVNGHILLHVVSKVTRTLRSKGNSEDERKRNREPLSHVCVSRVVSSKTICPVVPGTEPRLPVTEVLRG